MNSQPERWDAVATVGSVLRAVNHAAVMTEAEPAALLEAAEYLSKAKNLLEQVQRPLTTPPSLDDFTRAIRVYNPVVGMGSGLAVPLVFTDDEDGVIAHAEFGPAYEGPPMHLHGGVAAMLMDQTLARAMFGSGRWGMTAGLEMRYRRPVPLNTPVVLRARVAAGEGRRTTTTGTIALAGSPETALAEASAVFITPSEQQVRSYFGAMSQPTEEMGSDSAR